jgi:hypothetical protein
VNLVTPALPKAPAPPGVKDIIKDLIKDLCRTGETMEGIPVGLGAGAPVEKEPAGQSLKGHQTRASLKGLHLV